MRPKSMICQNLLFTLTFCSFSNFHSSSTRFTVYLLPYVSITFCKFERNFLTGYNFLGKVKCFKGGHQLSNLFLRQLFEKNNDKFEFIELNVKKEDNLTKVSYKKNNITSIAVNA